MTEVVDRILEYLQQHNFTMAGDALRAEITARRTSNGALYNSFSSFSEFITDRSNSNMHGFGQKPQSYEWPSIHSFMEFPFYMGKQDARVEQQEQAKLGLVPDSSEMSYTLAQATDQQFREEGEEMTGHPQSRGSMQEKLSVEEAAFWQGGNGIHLSDMQVESVQESVVDSKNKKKSYKQAVQTNIPRAPEAKVLNEGAYRFQQFAGEDLEKRVSSSQRDASLEAISSLHSDFPITSEGINTKMPIVDTGILPVLSGDTQVMENGLLRDGFNRTSATHVRLKTGFPFSLSSSYQTPPCKYQDDNESINKSAGAAKNTQKVGEYFGERSSSSCKQLGGSSNTNNDDSTNSTTLVAAKVLMPHLPEFMTKSASFAQEPYQEVTHQCNISASDDASTLGLTRGGGNNWPPDSQDIAEELPKSVQEDGGGKYTPSDAFVENWGFDAYEDEDPGYYRQPIEDEAWFLAHEIDYPSDDERGRLNVQANHHYQNNDDCNNEVHSCASEELFFSGEEYYKNRRSDRDAVTVLHHSENPSVLKSDQVEKSATVVGEDMANQGNCIDEGLDDKVLPYHTGILERGFLTATEGDWYGSRTDVYGNDSDAHFGSEVRNSLTERSSEEESFDYGGSKTKLIRSSSFQQRFVEAAESRMDPVEDSFMQNDAQINEFHSYYDEARIHKDHYCDPLDMEERPPNLPKNVGTTDIQDAQTFCQEDPDFAGFDFTGFSFPSPSSAGELVGSRADSGKSLWSGRDAMTQSEDIDEFGNGVNGADDTLVSWRRKSGEFSPLASPQDDALFNMASSTHSTTSVNLFDDYVSEVREEDIEEAEASVGNNDYIQAATIDGKDREALEEQLQRLQACAEEYETFNLRIIHRKNRTGFEEDKDFPVEINSVIAGRYYVTEYLGSAAFSKAIQAHDLYTGLDVCMKIVKNNKDFFDQSLDEIKLLKYINKHDPADKHHILRLYDYFYHREHLFIVCELLRANLYEFQKYNKESGGEVYFTMPRLQSITRQCLEALEFLHQLGLIHCDLKPENILIKSYSRCEVKVIDLGSSCFQTDNLCSYVQSRSYRAPEVILGLPYDQKIDLWSLGCILAELCSGHVLFQNESLPTLLALVTGIIGAIDSEMLAEGSDTYKYFTKNHMLYERNQETSRLHYLIPKMTSLAHKLPMGDEGFIEFVGYLLQIDPKKRPSAREALNHSWINYPYEPVSS
ncbi:hypothetical protein O6H91_04G097700 [Diphasiastrum complanatum]|uniref:Uncharacterized protein n=2 Tax=Diphasiastrum complanatum TaxID=34168 RepID=A0ACC2DZY5_DIPCM|nr:hypothetical protein O6H91_04G097700 [Diphasiastrum complanatum]KAJ7559720.1 hypothetical protein O6H91_04G097700 [Diphasiastrum complanatum]